MTAQVSTEHLSAIMQSARRRTLELLDGLTDVQLVGPRLPIVNPLIWEIGHVAWFYEFFILRQEYGHRPLLDRGDLLYDSIAIAHNTRWDLPVYPLTEMKDYMARVLDTLLDRLDHGLAGERDSYLYQFTTFHEDMHNEAFTWARQTLAYPKPSFFSEDATPNHVPVSGSLRGDAVVPGGSFRIGSCSDDRFVFDNEKWAHDIHLEQYRMARTPVTCGQFSEFVEDGGYEDNMLWSDDGYAWREEVCAKHPVYWARDKTGSWRIRLFDRWNDFSPDQPVVHVNWHEASAYCIWAGRRLPTEAEWEFAATMRPSGNNTLVTAAYPWGDAAPSADRVNMDGFLLGCADVADYEGGDSAWGCRQMIGNVWEWTADTFNPFPGFAPDDYKEYSEPLFGVTKVLRGGSWVTRSRYINSRYRNYFGPERRDIFSGFRTCAVDA
ncbi:MAG: selenoneine synthase SenA [Pseudomonadota bacterium]|nr:selenoneine synthase SenA [Pseudomonadota bacterium]